MKIIDKANLPIAIEFIEAELSAYDTSKVDWFKLLPLSKRAHFHGRCTYPKRTAPRKRSFIHGYQIRCSVNTKASVWPWTIGIATSTWQKEINSVKHWGYNYETVRYENAIEAAVFLALSSTSLIIPLSVSKTPFPTVADAT